MQESRTSEIRLDGVTLRFEHGIQALDDLSLDVPLGQHLCILGANGSGKSTLAAVISGRRSSRTMSPSVPRTWDLHPMRSAGA